MMAPIIGNVQARILERIALEEGHLPPLYKDTKYVNLNKTWMVYYGPQSRKVSDNIKLWSVDEEVLAERTEEIDGKPVAIERVKIAVEYMVRVGGKTYGMKGSEIELYDFSTNLEDWGCRHYHFDAALLVSKRRLIEWETERQKAPPKPLTTLGEAKKVSNEAKKGKKCVRQRIAAVFKRKGKKTDTMLEGIELEGISNGSRSNEEAKGSDNEADGKAETDQDATSADEADAVVDQTAHDTKSANAANTLDDGDDNKKKVAGKKKSAPGPKYAWYRWKTWERERQLNGLKAVA